MINNRDAVLDVIRRQVGDSNYRKLVDAIGEDGILETVARQMAEGASGGAKSSSSSEPDSPWATGFSALISVIIEWGGWYWGIIPAYSGLGPLVGTLVVLGSMIGIVVGVAFLVAFARWVKTLDAAVRFLGWIAGIAVGIAAVAGIGYGVYLGTPWLAKGVAQWWTWLGSHF